jgi:hypothetical protein
MKIKLTERQLNLVLNESMDPLPVLDTAIAYGIPVKKHSRASKAGFDSGNTWHNIYPDANDQQIAKIERYIERYGEEYIPELISGVGHSRTDGKTDFDTSLVEYVYLISKRSGIPLVITGGDDLFHQKKFPNSAHADGAAIDFVAGTMDEKSGSISADHSNKTQAQIEMAIIELIEDGVIPYQTFGLINEYKNPSGGATAGHFHMSNSKSDRFMYFHFIDKFGKVVDNPKSRNDMFTPSNLSKKHDIFDKFFSTLKYLKKKQKEEEERKVYLERKAKEKEEQDRIDQLNLLDIPTKYPASTTRVNTQPNRHLNIPPIKKF